MNAKSFRLSILATFSVAMFLAPLTQAAVFQWSGIGGDLVWSDPLNWTPNTGTPGIFDTALFGNTGTNAGVGVGSNNVVSTSTQIEFLQYTNIGGSHSTFLNPGVTLTIATNSPGSSLFFGGGVNVNVTNTISGSGAMLVVTNSNNAGNINVREGGSGNNGQRATLDMSGLDTFEAGIGQFMVSGDGAGGPNATTHEVGTLLLAKTNTIHTYGSAPQLVVNFNSSSAEGSGVAATNNESFLYLGMTNAIFSDSIEIGDQKGAGACLFNPAFLGGANAPVAVIGGRSSSRVATFNIGDDTGQGSSNQQSLGLLDFTGGTVNALVGTCVVGDGQNGGGNSTGSVTGILNMGAGIFNVNVLQVSQQTATNCATPMTGTVNLEGGGTLMVNTLLELGFKYTNATATGTSAGTLNATNSAIVVNGTIVAGGGSSTIFATNSTFSLTNAGADAGTTNAPISSLTLGNDVVNLAVVPGQAKIVASNLTANGTITVNFTTVSGFTNFPINYQVIVVTNSVTPGIQGAGGAAFALGTLPEGVSATLVNDTASNSIDLLITSAPSLLGPLTWSGLSNGVADGNWDIGVTPDWLNSSDAASVYQDLNPVTLNDSAAGTTSIILNTVVKPASTTVSNAMLTYTISGTGNIGGPGSLTKLGTGTLTLLESGGDDFGGGLVVSNGTLNLDDPNSATAGGTTIGDATVQVGNNDANGSLSAPIVNNGTLIVDRSDATLTLSLISGTGSLSVIGSGTVTLTGTQTYTGPTTVTGGTLGITGPNAAPGGICFSSNLTINAGGTVVVNSDNSLEGSGTNALNVFINAGGTLTGNAAADSGAGTSSHLEGILTFNGGTLAMGGTSINTTEGSWDLQGSPTVVVLGGPVTSTLSALDMVPEGSPTTVFDVTNGTTPSGIDLLVSGTLISASSQADTGITKNGPGVMALDNNNTYTHGTTVNGGTLLLGLPTDAAALTPIGSGSVTLATGGILELNSGQGLTIRGIISDDGTGTVLVNEGTNYFGAAENYTGNTILNAGTKLVLTNGSTINNNKLISVSNATLDISLGGALSSSGTLSLTNSSLNLASNLITSIGTFGISNSTLSFAALPADVNGENISVSGLFSTGGSTNIINLLAVPGYPVYPTNVVLIKYGSFGNVGANNTLTALGVSLPAAGAPTGYLTNDVNNNSIDLVLLSDTNTPVFPITWNGQTNGVNVGNWDILNTPDWVLTSDGVTPQKYQNADAATFDDTARGTTSINITTALAPLSLAFNNSAKAYTFTGPGSIGGSIGLVVHNPGSLAFEESGGDTFTGGITMEGGGTLTLSNASAGIAGGIIVYSGMLIDQHSGAINGGLTVNGGLVLLDQSGTINGGGSFNNVPVQVGNNDTNGSPPLGNITNNSTIVFDRVDTNLNVTSIISGFGGVTNNGTGTVTWSSPSNTFTGPVVLNAGIFVMASGNNPISGFHGSSGVIINNGAQVQVLIDNSLSGRGTPNVNILPILVNPGGILTGAPGADAGAGTSCHLQGVLTLNGGTLANSGTSSAANTFANGSWDLDDGVATDGTNVTSTITALCVAPTQNTGSGTEFDVIPGTPPTPSGVDLDVTGTIIHATSQADYGIEKTGNGVMRLSNTNTFYGVSNNNVAVEIDQGVLIVNAPETPGVSGPLGRTTPTNAALIEFNGGTLEYSSANTFDYSYRFAQDGQYSINTAGENVTFATGFTPGSSVTKLGTGTLTLASTTNSYNGATVVGGGTLVTTTTASGGGTYAVTNGGILDVQVAVPGAQLVMGTLTLGGSTTDSSTLKIDTLATGNPSAAPVNATGGITTNGTVNIALAGTALSAGTFPLIAYSGTSPSGSLNFTPPTGFTGSLSDNNAGLISVTLVAAAAPTKSASITKVSLSGTNLIIQGTNNNTPNTSFRFEVLSSTNVATPLSNWTPIFTNGFNPDGTFDYTNPIVPGTPQQFIDVKAVQ